MVAMSSPVDLRLSGVRRNRGHPHTDTVTIKAAPVDSRRPNRGRQAPLPRLSKPIRPSVIYLQHGQERFLRDFDAADPLHSLLAFLLLFQQLALSSDVAAVALGKDIFT